MTVLFKVPPMRETTGVIAVSAKPYGDVVISSGDRVFLWSSETQGGQGLVGHGRCLSANSDGGMLRAEVEIGALDQQGVGYGRDHLRPFRDNPSATPEATLAKKLYKHSLNKAVQITPDEETFLDTFF